jgi:hypothetical protein
MRDEVRGVGSLRFDAHDAADIEAALARLRAAAPSWLPVPELSFRGPEVQQQGPLVIPEALIILVILFVILWLIIQYLQRLGRGGTTPTPGDVEEIREKIRRALGKPKAKPEPKPEPDPKKKPEGPGGPDWPPPVPNPCREPWDPCPNTLSVSWPAILPLPEDVTLQRTPADVREAEGIDRGPAQRELAERIGQARQEGSPPPEPCFPEDVDPSEFYDAHHIHPLYLGGIDEPTNLCALNRDKHRAGHPQLDNQIEHLDEYLACRVCSPFLTEHPQLQEYAIVGEK